MCTAKHSNTQTASFFSTSFTLSHSHCSLPLSLSLSLTPPPLSKQSLPITQNLLPAKLHTVLLEVRLHLVTVVRHTGLHTCTVLCLLSFPPPYEALNYSSNLFKDMRCDVYVPRLVVWSTLRYNTATQCWNDLLWISELCSYNRHLGVFVFRNHHSQVKSQTLQTKRLHQVSFYVWKNTFRDLKNSEEQPPVKTPWIQHKPLNCTHISKVAMMGIRILKVRIVHRQVGLMSASSHPWVKAAHDYDACNIIDLPHFTCQFTLTTNLNTR